MLAFWADERLPACLPWWHRRRRQPIGIAGVTLVQLRRFELMRTGYIEERMGLRRTPARGLAASTMYPLPT